MSCNDAGSHSANCGLIPKQVRCQTAPRPVAHGLWPAVIAVSARMEGEHSARSPHETATAHAPDVSGLAEVERPMAPHSVDDLTRSFERHLRGQQVAPHRRDVPPSCPSVRRPPPSQPGTERGSGTRGRAGLRISRPSSTCCSRSTSPPPPTTATEACTPSTDGSRTRRRSR